jgi:hypothetical protein
VVDGFMFGIGHVIAVKRGGEQFGGIMVGSGPFDRFDRFDSLRADRLRTSRRDD